MTRGIKHVRDLLVAQLQSQFFHWKRKNLETGKDEDFIVQGALRPIELWEYVLPEECVDEFLTAIGKLYKDKDGKECAQCEGYWGTGKAKYGLPFLRKALGAKPINLSGRKPVPTSKIIYHNGVGMEIIGVKKDEKKDFPWGYNQEAL